MSLLIIVNAEKSKPPEKAGRKATGLSSLLEDMAAGLPGETSAL